MEMVSIGLLDRHIFRVYNKTVGGSLGVSTCEYNIGEYHSASSYLQVTNAEILL